MGKIRILSKKAPKKWFLFFGGAWIFVAVVSIKMEMNIWITVFYLLLGAIFILLSYKDKTYITIQNGILTKNGLFPKRIALDEVKKIKYFAEDYTLAAGEKKLTINTYAIEKNSLEKLVAVLKGLNAEWEE